MVRRNSGVILRQVHALFNVGTFSGLSDRQLLDRFLARHDEVSEFAFTVLVERHGPMVLGVCRRILVDPHDAEDAFQATFLVLVRKAGSVRVDGSVGRWLFGVATRVATRARADARRRRGRERPGLERLKVVAVEESLPAVERADLQSILAEEIGRLPVRLQAPVILCDLEGCSYEQSAQQLGWPVGTVKSRLSRARALLRTRLTRRGLVPDDRAITIPLLPMSLSRGLIETTTRAAQSLVAGRLTTVGVVSASVATLTEGVLRTMYWTKLKLAITATLLIVGGSAVVFSQAPAQKAIGDRAIVDNSSAPVKAADQTTTSEAAIDVEMLERAWAAAIPRRDAAIVNRIMADDFEGIDPIGNNFTKATYLSDLRSGAFSDQPIAFDELKTRIFGDTAVTTSRIKISTVPPSGRMTHAYVKRQGRWQCVAAHASWAGTTGTTRDILLRQDDQQGGMMGMMRNQPHAEGQMGAMMNMMRGMMRNQPQAEGQMAGMMKSQGQELTRLRPQFDCRVEKVLVKVGQTVKEGDPLLELFSIELAEAKMEYTTARSESERHHSRIRWSQAMFDKGFLSEGQLKADRNAEERSRLRSQVARDKLHVLGLDDEAIRRLEKEGDEEKARMTFRSPVGGIVASVGAEPGNRYDTKSVLVLIAPASSNSPAVPQ
jgi:RNA polymerase sigma factor (sigma-70 family)